MDTVLGIPTALSRGTPNCLCGTIPGMDTGKRIRALRFARGMSQKALAKAIGIAAPSLSQLETGVSVQPSGPVLAALCRVLHTNPDFLLQGVGQPGAHTSLDGDQTELVAIWNALPEAGQTALLATARGLRDAYGGKPTAENPFPKRQKAPRD
jgi:transcriptional regulator with XRE-family HTH domain